MEAVQWTGDAICLAGTVFVSAYHEGVVERIDKALPIRTLEGEILCSVGDYIIQGVKGEFHPVKPHIFIETYELLEKLC